MKKKLLFSGILALGLISQAQAQPQICPFIDHFTVNGPVGFAITHLSTDGNVHAMLSDAAHFNVFCKDNTSRKSGRVFVTIAIDPTNMCNLTITDGPFEMNPNVTDVSCTGGISYAGMDHEYSTYQYKLKFF